MSPSPHSKRPGSSESDRVQKSDGLNYERALQQLEEILDKMNGAITLEESVALYERADSLLRICAKKLREAENKIETLVKNRAGEMQLKGDGRPQIKSLQTASSDDGDERDETPSDQLPF